MDVRWLIVDSCGAVATLAVGRGEVVLARAELVGREFSAGWPGALREMLAASGFGVHEVQVVGVVSGPGSFTGVRVGLAAAKGLCEAVGAKLVLISRLELMQRVGVPEALAVLDAGRGEWFVRERDEERLVDSEGLAGWAGSAAVMLGDGAVPVFAAAVDVRRVALRAESALPDLLTRWVHGAFDDVASADANYVRGEREIYAKRPVSA